jgi:hypothetical protein
MVARILRLKTPPQPADASDGVAAALAYIMRPQFPQSKEDDLAHKRPSYL